MKYTYGIVTFVVLFILLVIFGAQLCAWWLYTLQPSSVLKDALIVDDTVVNDQAFIPADKSISDIVSDDLFITAWNINERTPRFFN